MTDDVAIPQVTVVVASHERTVRLRWLLNALEEQTLAEHRWELVVVFDDAGEASATALREHPLAGAGRLRTVRLPPGTGTPSRQRNVGWQAARAPLVAFTDDDCRPEPEWIEELLRVADTHGGQAIVQGATRPDPYESKVIGRAPRVRTIRVDPPGPFAQTCNILYPRAVLERLEGFDERFPRPSGEDTDLYLRAAADGTPYVPAPAAVVNHAVETFSLRAMIRLSWKWRDVPNVVKRHPVLRREYPLRLFWRRSHAALTLGLLVAGTVRSRRLAPLLFVPYLRLVLSPTSRRPSRQWLRAGVELPGRIAVDLTELAALIHGSIRYRTFFL